MVNQVSMRDSRILRTNKPSIQSKNSILHRAIVQYSCQRVLAHISFCFSQFSFEFSNAYAYIQASRGKQDGGFYWFTKFYANAKVPAITHCYGVSVSQKLNYIYILYWSAIHIVTDLNFCSFTECHKRGRCILPSSAGVF